VTESDRVLVGIPLTWSIGGDAYFARLDNDGLTFATDQPSVGDIVDFAPTVLLSTVSDALRLARATATAGVDLIDIPLRLAMVTAEPGGSLEPTRRSIEAQWGATCLDVYALTELGVVGWGCSQRRDGIHLDGCELELEVVEPGTEQLVAEGELGELVVSTPGDWGTPLERFHTGDLVRVRRDACECGRGSAWAEGGVLGRVSDRLMVRGQLILPVDIEQVVRRHPAVVDFALRTYAVRDEYAISVDLELTAALATEADQSRVAAEVSEDLRRTIGLRFPCDVVAPGAISGMQLPGKRARRISPQ
jgi:phenylacetate-CoA ligase